MSDPLALHRKLCYKARAVSDAARVFIFQGQHMQRINIDISGEGPHDVISPSAGKRFLINSCLMTFAHAHPESQPVTFMSGSTVLYGPYLVFDGEKLIWTRDPSETFDIKPGEAFRIKLATGVRCGATIDYEIGAW